MKQKLCSGFGVMIAVGSIAFPDPARAFDGDNLISMFDSIGVCQVQITFAPPPAAQAGVFIRDANSDQFFSGGSFHTNDVINTGMKLTQEVIESCLGSGAGSVTSFIADGAQGLFADDAYIGFSFVHDGIAYEFALSGATNTQFIVTKTPLAVAPTAPTSLVAVAGNGQISVDFTAPSDTGGSDITDYEYQLNGGDWISAGTTTSPVVITGLPNGIEYRVALRAVNEAGVSLASPTVAAIPSTAAAAPTNLVATSGDGEVSVTFTPPSDVGGREIRDYEYQLNGGAWVSAGTVTSPILIMGLVNGTDYSIAVRAVTGAGPGVASEAVSATPGTSLGAPTNLVATAGDAEVSVAFSAPTRTGGSAITDYEYQLNGGDWVSAGTTSSPVVITGLTNATRYRIALRAVTKAGPGEASASVVVTMPSPASEFAAQEAAIREVIVDEALRGLQSTISANQRMTRSARERVIADQLRDGAGGGEGDVPFDVSGTLNATGESFSSRGVFYGAQGMADGTRRLVFGDFDVQHDSESGSSTTTFGARMAWERMFNERTLLGYFVGGEMARSSIAGAFSGDQNRIGVSVGGYGVRQLTEQVYLDGFLSFGAGRNDLELADDVLALDSDYTTRSVTTGVALTGVIERPGHEIWPELSFSFGRTWIGDVDFTGRAYGIVDSTLSLDAGSVTLSNVMFRPEVRVPLDGLTSTESLQLLTFAPRLICERVETTQTEDSCGGGAEIGFSGQSGDGLSLYSATFSTDSVGDQTRSALQLNVEYRF